LSVQSGVCLIILINSLGVHDGKRQV